MTASGSIGTRRGWLLVYAGGSLAWVAGWYGLKVLHFHALDYIADVFSSLTASRSWLEGYPFLYDFRYGDTLRYHTYFLTGALAPFTAWLGVRGLFLAHALLVWSVPFYVLRQFPDPVRTRWLLLLLITLYWGPYGAWLFDDYQFGWHAELFFFPLSLFFAAALLARQRWAIASAGLLLVLVREDGPVVGCCLHLFALAVRADGFRGWSVSRVVRSLLPVVGTWLGLFVVLMGILLGQSFGHGVRFVSAFYAFWRVSPGLQAYVLAKYLLEMALMFLPFGMLAWQFFGRRMLVVLVLCGVPLGVTAMVGSALYPDHTWYGISWAPRMAMLMGYALGGLVLLTGYRTAAFSLGARRVYALGLVLILTQWLTLAVVRRYNGLVIDGQTARQVMAAKPDSPRRILWELAERIPRRAYVAADYEFYAPFEWHRYIWIDHDRIQYAPVVQPDFIVTAGGTVLPYGGQTIPMSAYVLERHGSVRVYRRRDFR
jgi:hypothetical protein